MRRLAVVVLALSWPFAFASPALAWGAAGHRIINGDAIRALPASVPGFVRTPEAIAEITMLGPEADRLRAAGKVFDADRDPAHFLDVADDGTVDGVVPLANLPPTREAYDTALRRGAPIDGRAADEYVAGYLPYEIADGYEQLVEDFAIWRADAYGEAHATDPAQRALFGTGRHLRETLTLRDIGYWGHFVGDGSQPLHASIHYNGWGDYPDPNGYSNAHTVHAYFETTFVNAHASPETVQPRIAAFAPSIQPILTRLGAYLLATNAGVPKVYQLFDAGALERGTPDAVGFVLDRLAAGAQMLRDLIADAYAESTDAGVGYPAVRVRDVEAGTVPPPLPSVRN